MFEIFENQIPSFGKPFFNSKKRKEKRKKEERKELGKEKRNIIESRKDKDGMFLVRT